ncbi:putative RNA-binding domain superfamily [Helianthus debilis subsp. tardiflorus]
MPANVVVLWQEAVEGKEAAGGKVWSLKRTWQQQENWATAREQGSNKEMMKLINFTDQYGGGSFAKKKLSGGSVTKLSVSSVPKTVTKEDIRHAFDEHGQVEVALVKIREQGSNKISWDVLRQISARVVAKVLIEVVVSKVVVKEVF